MYPSNSKTRLTRLATAAKIVIPLLIIAWLVSSVDPRQLRDLATRSIRWPLMLAAFGGILLAVCLSFIRWYFLVRALELPFRLRDAFRLGFLGFFCNFVSVGAVGGDLFKAVFIAREHPGRRTLAVASVLVDRIMGVHALLIVTAIAMLVGGISNPSTELLAVQTTTYAAAIISSLGILVVLTPGFTSGPFAELLSGLPKIGVFLGRIIEAVRFYRRQGLRLVGLGLLSMSIHLVIASSVTLIARALYDSPPSLTEHLIIVNLSSAVGALPFTPAGLGTFELAMTTLYEVVPRGAIASGVIVALGYRLITITIAAIGVVVFFASRREVAQLQQAIDVQEAVE